MLYGRNVVRPPKAGRCRKAPIGSTSVFSTLVDKLDAEVRIVLSSTWRAGMSPDGQPAAQYSHLENVLDEYGLKIYDRTPVSNKGRQKEIEYYI